MAVAPAIRISSASTGARRPRPGARWGTVAKQVRLAKKIVVPFDTTGTDVLPPRQTPPPNLWEVTATL
jgi:hypothetical protein